MAIITPTGITGINSITSSGNSLSFQNASGASIDVSGLKVAADSMNVSGIVTASRLNVGTGGTIISTTTGGSIGIGTTNPGGKIHIRTSTGSDIAGGSDSHIIFDLADDSGPAWAQRLYKGSAGGGGVLDGSFALDKRTGAVWTNVLTARRDTSSVGIGTTNPYGKTHIEISAAAGAGSGNACAIWLKNANQTANNSATIFAGNDSSAACAAINFVHANYSNNQGFISFDTRENALTYNSNAFKIDAYGRVTSPYQPMCYVVYTGTAIARSTRIPLVTTNGTYPGTNQGNHWSNSTNIFTCPVAGVYHASLNIFGNATQPSQCQPTIRKNSGIVAYSYYPGGGVSISILCAANDTIDFVYNHDNAGYNGADAAWASVYLLG